MRPSAPASRAVDLVGCVRHFFDDPDLQAWACVSANHAQKFGDLAVWETYKAPAKEVIRAYTGDDEYYRTKTKVGSLAREGEDSDYVRSLCGILDPGDGTPPIELWWGVGSLIDAALREKYGPGVLALRTGAAAVVARIVDLDPWTLPPVVPSPFEGAGGCFAGEDERQARWWNPVTRNTLEGKCAALLPPELVRGHTVLDLGACIGAMCHYALCAGARRAIAVEVQGDFCHRAAEMLRRAWPDDDAEGQGSGGAWSGARFEVVKAGIREYLETAPAHSADVVVAAGVLHCFTDPVAVLLDMCRVARLAVVIECDHVEAVQRAFVDEPSHRTGSLAAAAVANIAQLAPQALCNLAGGEHSVRGLAVVPSRHLLESVLDALGFGVTHVRLAPHPTAPDDLATYTTSKGGRITPQRFFLRAVRRAGPAGAITTLEASVKAGTGDLQPWRHRPTWYSFGASGANEPAAGARASGSPADAALDPNISAPAPAPFMSWSLGRVPDFDGDAVEAARGRPPFGIDVWGAGRAFADADDGSVFGFVLLGSGPARLEVPAAAFACELQPGMYFAAPGPVRVEGGRGVAVTRPGVRTLFALGGPLEARGRLPYIDGCSDTLLLAPARRGDPCLNHLHLPASVRQTLHTHPSGCAGVVARGRGRCVWSEAPGAAQHSVDLTPGTVFVIPSDCSHAFETVDHEALDVVAFHPDSGFGPTAQDHPMVNGTMVDGVPASRVPAIRTPEDVL